MFVFVCVCVCLCVGGISGSPPVFSLVLDFFCFFRVIIRITRVLIAGFVQRCRPPLQGIVTPASMNGSRGIVEGITPETLVTKWGQLCEISASLEFHLNGSLSVLATLAKLPLKYAVTRIMTIFIMHLRASWRRTGSSPVRHPFPFPENPPRAV